MKNNLNVDRELDCAIRPLTITNINIYNIVNIIYPYRKPRLSANDLFKVQYSEAERVRRMYNGTN